MKKYFTLLIFISLFILVLNAIYYASEVSSTYIRADDWRFLKNYLIPIYNNNFHWQALWEDYHPQPLTALMFIVDGLYFNLNSNIFFYVGIISKVLFAVILSYLIYQSLKGYWLSLLLITITFFHWFSLNSIAEYNWPLVLGANLYFLIIIFVLYNLERTMQLKLSNNSLEHDKTTHNVPNKYWYYFIISVLLIVFLSKSLAYLLFASISVLFITLYAINKKKLFITQFVVILTSIVTLKLFFLFFDIAPYKLKLITNEFSLIPGLNRFSTLMLSGLLHYGLIKTIEEPIIILTLGYVLLAIYFFTLFYYIKNKLFNVTVIPIVLMLYPLFFILAALLYRQHLWQTHDEMVIVMVPRYVPAFELGIISMFWSWGLLFKEVFDSHVKAKVVSGIIAFFVVLNSLGNMIVSWYLVAPKVRSTHENTVMKIINYDGGKEKSLAVPGKFGSSFSDNNHMFLKKHKLDVFHEDYKPKVW